MLKENIIELYSDEEQYTDSIIKESEEENALINIRRANNFIVRETKFIPTASFDPFVPLIEMNDYVFYYSYDEHAFLFGVNEAKNCYIIYNGNGNIESIHKYITKLHRFRSTLKEQQLSIFAMNQAASSFRNNIQYSVDEPAYQNATQNIIPFNCMNTYFVLLKNWVFHFPLPNLNHYTIAVNPMLQLDIREYNLLPNYFKFVHIAQHGGICFGNLEGNEGNDPKTRLFSVISIFKTPPYLLDPMRTFNKTVFLNYLAKVLERENSLFCFGCFQYHGLYQVGFYYNGKEVEGLRHIPYPLVQVKSVNDYYSHLQLRCYNFVFDGNKVRLCDGYVRNGVCDRCTYADLSITKYYESNVDIDPNLKNVWNENICKDNADSPFCFFCRRCSKHCIHPKFIDGEIGNFYSLVAECGCHTEDVCNTCGYCLDCCECYYCPSCDETFSDVCGYCERCESCCYCDEEEY